MLLFHSVSQSRKFALLSIFMLDARLIDPTTESNARARLDRLFEAAKKRTVIQLRWPLVILCCYLLLYSPGALVSAVQAQMVVLFYLLTNATLYFVAEDHFESPFFYGPLLLFDTVFIATVLGISGGATTDFYVACFLTLILSCICNDSRGLLVVTLMAPVLYGYVVLNSQALQDPNVYLRLPFPLVIALFFGYFAQVERIKRTSREHEKQAKRHKRAADAIHRQSERLTVLHDVNIAVTSTLDAKKILETVLDKIVAHLPYAAAAVRLRTGETSNLETITVRRMTIPRNQKSTRAMVWIDGVAETRIPLIVNNISTDLRADDLQCFLDQGFMSLLVVPLVSRSETQGCLAVVKREAHEFSSEEIDFLLTLARHAGIAVHHLKLFERIQEQAIQLRLANKVKDEFVGVISHELKTPLNVISGYSNMLIEGMLGAVTPIQEKALDTVVRQTKELNGLVNSMLQVSNMEAEALKIEVQEINVWEFLSELRSSFDYPLSKNVNVHWEFPVDLPTVFADRGKLRHIMENLINNAIKFTEEGSVTVSAHYLSSKKMMEFCVADTGIGISKDLLPMIFERFRQADSSETRAHGGIGLGLYIVKKYTEILHGTIDVKSQPGRGSMFTLRVPRESPKQTAARALPAGLPIEEASVQSNALS